MAISDYTSLCSALGDWLNRTDLTAVVPSFVGLAEVEFNRRFRLRQQLSRVATVLDEEYEELPADFLEASSLTVNDSTRLEYVTPSAMDDLKLSGGSGVPTYYTLKGGLIQFFPSPSGSPALEMSYYASIPALSDETATNFLLTVAPDLYLYGALVHASPYLQDDPRIKTWASLYQNAYDAVLRADESAKTSGSPLLIRSAVRW